MKQITLKLDNGKEKVKDLKDLDFINVICDLEDKGVDIFKMGTGQLEDLSNMHTIRLIFATIIEEPDERKAGKILSEHIRNGGNIDEVFTAFGELMESGGFGGSPETEETDPAAMTTKLQ